VQHTLHSTRSTCPVYVIKFVRYCNTLQHSATHYTATHYNTLCNTPYCNTLQYSATDLTYPHDFIKFARCCNTRQHSTATQYNTLQHTLRQHTILQHTTTLCNTLHHFATDLTYPHDLIKFARYCNTLQHSTAT